MKYYEPFQRLDYGYKKTETNLQIYLRASIGVFLPKGVALNATTTGKNPKWEIHLSPIIANSAIADYVWERPELFYLATTDKPPASTAAANETMVKQEIASLLAKFKLYTVTTIVYNEKGTPVGQVTNTIASDGQVVVL